MMMAAYSLTLVLIVSCVFALVARAWMESGHWRCHQKCRSVEYPPVAWDKESEYAIVDGSLGMRGAMGQCCETKLLARINMMRSVRLLRHLEM